MRSGIYGTQFYGETKSDTQYRESYIAFNFMERDQKCHTLCMGRFLMHMFLQSKTKNDTQQDEWYIRHTILQREQK